MKVPNEGGIQNLIAGNPGTLLRPVPLPINEVLVSPTATPHVQETMDRPRRVIVYDPGRRWGRNGGRPRVGGDGFDLGDMEGWMHTERWRKS